MAAFAIAFIAWQCFLPYSHGITKVRQCYGPAFLRENNFLNFKVSLTYTTKKFFWPVMLPGKSFGQVTSLGFKAQVNKMECPVKLL